MTTIHFSATTFRTLYPPYANGTVYTDSLLQIFWDTATAFISDKTGGCYALGMSTPQRVLSLNLMTAHLLYLNGLIGKGETPGITTGATIDKISVQFQPPPEGNNWQYWLNQSPYGQQLLALLQLAGVGGFYYGGFPTVGTIRR